MRRIIISTLTAASLLLALCSFSFTSSARRPDKDEEKDKDKLTKSLEGRWDKLPPQAKLGASPEAKAAWDRLTAEERKAVKRKVNEIFGKYKDKEERDKIAKKYGLKLERKDDESEATLTVTDKSGGRRQIKAKKRGASVASEATAAVRSPRGRGGRRDAGLKEVRFTKAAARQQQAPQTPWGGDWAAAGSGARFTKASYASAPAAAVQEDADGDGLPESFEDALANAFTPIYHVSASEPDNYATFENLTTQTVKARFGPNPISHYRVQPLYIKYNPRTYMYESFIRIDYLTLWDHDSGLVGGNCDAFPPFGSLEGYQAHDLDNERSALLVSAPCSTLSTHPSST